jgi:hypothetical protein
MVISHLFWDQSEHWKSIAKRHADAVATVCKTFLLEVIGDHFIASEVKSRLLSFTVLPALKVAREAASNELKQIEQDRKRHPLTYNHYFTDTLQKVQQERSARRIMKIADEAKVEVNQKTWAAGPGYEPRGYIHPETLQEKLSEAIERDMDKYSAEQALDAHDAFYKVCKKACV